MAVYVWPRFVNYWSRCVWVLLLLMLCARLGFSVQECMSACNTVPNEWNSELRVKNRMAREVTLAWNTDNRLGATSYMIQFRERFNVQTFNTSPPISNTMYTIDGLTPNATYEGQVCRVNGSTSEPDNCGNCLFCFSTTEPRGQLRIYQARVTTSTPGAPPGVEIWRVEGVATVELGGLNPPTYVFDCNSTVNNGSGITWSRLGGAQIAFSITPLANGKRLDASNFMYEDLGEYSCRDQTTNYELILNITDSNPAVCPVSSTVGIMQGLSTSLEVYISGYPPVRSSNVHWYRLNPTRQEITSGATFHDSRRRMVLSNVQTSDAGVYLCEAVIPLVLHLQLRASATIDLQVYVPSTIVDQPYNIQNMSVVAEWSDLSLRCSATASPLPTIRWEREGGTPLPVDTQQIPGTNNDLVTSTLIFPTLRVRYDDRGRYRCVASNPHTNPAFSNYILISVTPTLRLSAAINGQAQLVLGDLLFAPEGSVIKAECFGSGILQWQNSSGSRISSNSQSMFYQEADPSRSVQTLNIRNFTRDTIDTYTCMTDLTTDGQTPVQLSLFITSSNPAVFVSDEIQYVLAGNTASLVATVHAHPSVDMAGWYFNDTPIDTGARYTASMDNTLYTLRIEDVQGDQLGLYEFVATVGNQTASDNILLVYPVPSTIVDQPYNIQNMSVVAEWSDLSLRCSATASPLPTIRWEREGGTPLPVDTQQIPGTNNDLVTSTLVFPTLRVRYDDRGRYRCVASNPHTNPAFSNYILISVTPTLRLSAAINGQAQLVLGDLLFASEGSVVKAECFGSGILQWQNSSGSRISSNSQSMFYQEADPSRSVQTLNIRTFTRDTIDTYTCMTDLTTDGQTPVQLSLFITSSNPAVFISDEIQYVLAGNTASLVAMVHAHPSVDMAGWYLNDTPIDTGARYTASVDNTLYTLRIEDVQGDQLGLYEFVATVGNQTASDNILLVYPDPPTSSISPSTITANDGDRVQFQCQVGGSETLSVEWRVADGSVLPSGVVQSGNDLIIARVESSHAGTYVCAVENLVGMVEDTAVLNVFHPPNVVITYQQISATPSSPRHIDLTDGGEAPTFSCSADGYLSPVLRWRRGDGSPLPDGVDSVEVSGRGQPVRELRWSRTLRFTDSGSYMCMAVNDNGTSIAELDVLVRHSPEINTISPMGPVQSNRSSSPPAFAIPTSYVGVALTCTAFAWPPPSVQWLKNGSSLPNGVTTEMVIQSNAGIISANLKWTQVFSSSDVGQYTCLVSSNNNTIQSIVEIQSSSSPTVAPSLCSIESTSAFFQVRVLNTGCDQWAALLREHIGNQFQEELIRIVETNCNCTLPPDSVQINIPPQCSENSPGGVVFRGAVRTSAVTTTEEIFCTILTWQQRGPLINLNANLHQVDSECNLQVDSFTRQECAVTPTSAEPDIIIIAAPVGGVLVAGLVIVVVVLCCIYFCSKKKRGKRGRPSAHVWQQPKDAPTLQRAAFHNGPVTQPSQQVELRGRYNDSVFDEPTYSDPLPRVQRTSGTRSTDPSPEHFPLEPIRSVPRDRLLGSDSSGPPRPQATSHQVDTRVQPYSLPINSTGSLSMVGRTYVHPQRAYSPSAVNPLSVAMNGTSAADGNHRRYSEGIPASPVAYPLPALDKRQRVESTMFTTFTHGHPRSARSNSRSLASPASASSIVKLPPASFSQESISEQLPPYSPRPPSLMETTDGDSVTNGSIPWYQTDSDMSLNRSGQRIMTAASSRSRIPSNIQPYVTIQNSAIPPFTNQRPRTDYPSRTQPGPYMEPVGRSSNASIDTFTRVQNSPHLEVMV